MSLQHIEYGSLASSELMNDNFEYLDNRVSSVAENITSTATSIYSNIASLSSTLTNANNSLESDLSDLTEYAQSLRSDFDTLNNAPDYSKGIGISLPYSVSQNGYVYAGVDGLDNAQYVYVNGSPVIGHCGSGYGGHWVYSGCVFRVSAGDVVTSSRPSGGFYFYPMKGILSTEIENDD